MPDENILLRLAPPDPPADVALRLRDSAKAAPSAPPLPPASLTALCGPVSYPAPHAPLARRILALADDCLDKRATMDAFAAPYRAQGRTAQLVLSPAFRVIATEFTLAFTRLVEAIDAAEHPHAHPSTTSPSSSPLDWRPLIADVRLLAALDAGIAREREHVRALAVARFREIYPEA